MSYDVTFETYDPSRAWFASRARDALQPFPFAAAATLRERVGPGPALDEALLRGLGEIALAPCAVACRGAPRDGEPRQSYVFVDEGRAAVVLEPSHRGVAVRVAAQGRAEALELLDRIDRLVPRRKACPEDVVGFRFWRLTPGCGAKYTDRDLRCPSVESLQGNYTPALFQDLQRLAGLDRPDGVGKVILWHGPPGTGKTYAVRALARAWKQQLSASVEVVLDPDELFARADYLHDVLLDDELDEWDEDDDDGPHGLRGALRRPLRLVIIEDSAALFGESCRSTPGFARLLNMSDGIIGQGLRVVFLLTTNEQLEGIDPAITRPGRCLAVNAFDQLPLEIAQRWMSERGGDPSGVTLPVTLSELFGARA